MEYDDIPQNKISNRTKHLVRGLRNYAIPSDCYVFEMKPDGSKGEFLRIEKPKIYERDFKFGKGINI